MARIHHEDAPPDEPDDEEAGGYGRPPLKGRIKDGERRNPWGRKGRQKPLTDFLDERIEIRNNGKPESVTREQALDHFLFMEASRGNVSAAKFLDQRRQNRKARNADAVDTDTLSREEEFALLRATGRRLRKLDQDIADKYHPDHEPETEPSP